MIKQMMNKKWPSVEELPYKIFYFLFYAGYMPLLLFLPVYFKYIGLTPVYVGILAGIRLILQSIGTPFLVAVGERFRSQKMLFIISCVVMASKVLIIFLFLRPTEQLCTTKYTNVSDQTVSKTSHTIEHRLSKRSLVMDHWSTRRNNAMNNIFNFEKKKIVNDGTKPVEINRQNENENETRFNSSHLINSTTRPNLPSPIERSKNFTVEHIIVNNDSEVYHIFVALVILALLGDCFETTIFTLVDNSYTANLGTESYGSTRLWGNLGWGVMTPVIGIVIFAFDQVLCSQTVGSFHFVFFFFLGFCNIALLVGSHLDFTPIPLDVITTEVHSVLSNFQYGLFMFASSYSAFCNGFVFTFVNWFIDTLGGSAVIMGIATGCKCIVDVALFFLLQNIINYFGHMATMSISFLGHLIVFLAFFAVHKAWLVIIVETIHGIFYTLMTSTSISFLIYAAPTGSSPRMQAILQGVYWGIGTGCGAIFGGYCLENVGFRQTFLAFTVITCIVAFVFLTIQMMVYIQDPDALNDLIKSESSSNFGDDEEESSTETDEENDLQKE